jgi:hypothetical protein
MDDSRDSKGRLKLVTPVRSNETLANQEAVKRIRSRHGDAPASFDDITKTEFPDLEPDTKVPTNAPLAVRVTLPTILSIPPNYRAPFIITLALILAGTLIALAFLDKLPSWF